MVRQGAEYMSLTNVLFTELSSFSSKCSSVYWTGIRGFTPVKLFCFTPVNLFCSKIKHQVKLCFWWIRYWARSAALRILSSPESADVYQNIGLHSGACTSSAAALSDGLVSGTWPPPHTGPSVRAATFCLSKQEGKDVMPKRMQVSRKNEKWDAGRKGEW